jgi:microcystin-dependent protein
VTLTSAQSGLPAHSHSSTASFSGSFTGTAASHNHTQDAHSHVMNYADGGSYGGTRSVLNANRTTGTDSGEMSAAQPAIQNTSITPAGSISGTVTMTNPNNTAANASSAVSLMQPTMVLNYIIKV